MRKKKFARDPLLYINQPGIKTPEAPMQHHYASPKKKSKAESTDLDSPLQQNAAPPKGKSAYLRALEQAQSQHNTEKNNMPDDGEAVEQIGETEKDDSSHAIDPEEAKNFKEMDLEEKVNYFIHAPKFAPVLKCKIQTEEKNYRGVITDYKDGNVYIRPSKGISSKEVPLDQITDIKMLGF